MRGRVSALAWGSLLALGSVGCGWGDGAEPAPEVAAAPAPPLCPLPKAGQPTPTLDSVDLDDGAQVDLDWLAWAVKLSNAGDLGPDRLWVCVDGRVAERETEDLRHQAWDRDVHMVVAWVDTGRLEPGRHALRFVAVDDDDRYWFVDREVEVVRPPHAVRVEVKDGRGRPVTARLVVTRDGEPFPLGSQPHREKRPRDLAIHSAFAVGGEAVLHLPPGRYEITAVRSLFDRAPSQQIEVPDRDELVFKVQRLFDPPDEVWADLHVHTGRSYDSRVPDRLRWASLLAAGLDVVLATDHNRITDPRPYLEHLLADLDREELLGFPGIEADIRQQRVDGDFNFDIAHFNAFPLATADIAPVPPKVDKVVSHHIDRYRERQRQAPFEGREGVVLQLNHPRGIQFFHDKKVEVGGWPLFNHQLYDPALPVGEGPNAWMAVADPESGTTAMDWDAMEVINRFSHPLWLEVRRDWFALLDQGLVMTGTGNSDSHALQVEVAGMTVNRVHLPDPGPDGAFDADAFFDAVDGGRLTVTTGPLVDLTVRGADGAEATPGDTLRGPGPYVAEIRVRAVPWVEVPEVRLVVDGEVVWEEPVPPARGNRRLDRRFEIPLEAGRDRWILAEAGWPDEPGADEVRPTGPYAVIAPDYVPIGFTNPVFVDADADGWEPPGL